MSEKNINNFIWYRSLLIHLKDDIAALTQESEWTLPLFSVQSVKHLYSVVHSFIPSLLYDRQILCAVFNHWLSMSIAMTDCHILEPLELSMVLGSQRWSGPLLPFNILNCPICKDAHRPENHVLFNYSSRIT